MANKEVKPQKTEKEVITYYLYSLEKSIIVNERIIKQVLISSHCDKHSEHGITRELIIELAQLLDGRSFPPSGDKQPAKKNYFKDYPEKDGKRYKLVW